MRILTSPTRLDGLRLGHVASLVSVDAVCRWAAAAGERTEWIAATLAGDLGGQRAVERQLAREGLDRDALGREAFVERVRAFESDGRAALGDLLGALGVSVDLAAGALDAEPTARAAAAAFVRLYEAGLLARAERVVRLCPRCQTVVDPADALAAESEAEAQVLALGPVSVAVVAAELLPAAVAVAVPEGHPAAGSEAPLPLGGRTVPVVAAAVDAPRLVVPAHDPDDHAIAMAHGLAVTPALDADGTVVAGPFSGLARHAARAATREALEAENACVATEVVAETVSRCKRCKSELVPSLGLHWFLAMAGLEVDAADAAREAVEFTPAAMRERLQERAGQGEDWCLSHQVWAGQPVPVATCLDCGAVAVGVDVGAAAGSCGRCMGTLEPDGGVLDARFVGAVWPLAAAGWPADERGPEHLAASTTLVVGPSGIAKWALPMAALGRKLAGAVPFCRVAVLDLADGPEGDPDPVVPEGLDAVVADEGVGVVRAALISGAFDMAKAAAVARAAAAGAAGAPSAEPPAELAEAVDAAYAAVQPAAALTLIAGAAADGIDPAALAAPLLGAAP